MDVVLTWCGNDIEAARALASEVSAGDFFIWDVILKPILSPKNNWVQLASLSLFSGDGWIFFEAFYPLI